VVLKLPFTISCCIVLIRELFVSITVKRKLDRDSPRACLTAWYRYFTGCIGTNLLYYEVLLSAAYLNHVYKPVYMTTGFGLGVSGQCLQC